MTSGGTNGGTLNIVLNLYPQCPLPTPPKLTDFLADLFSLFVAPPEPKRTAFERLGDDPAERVSAVKSARRADAALKNIADDLKRGETVAVAEIRSLSRGHLQEIAQNGDAGLLALIKRMEEDRERDPGHGLER